METVTIKGNLTPDFMNEKLGPFLESIQNIQHIFDEIKQVTPSPVKINEISWEGVDSIENDNWSDISRGTIFIEQAMKALAGLRETLDYLNEEPNNQDVHFASVRMAKSLFEALSLSVEPDLETYIEARYVAQRISKFNRVISLDDPASKYFGLLNTQYKPFQSRDIFIDPPLSSSLPILRATSLHKKEGDE